MEPEGSLPPLQERAHVHFTTVNSTATIPPSSYCPVRSTCLPTFLTSDCLQVTYYNPTNFQITVHTAELTLWRLTNRTANL